MPDDDIPAGAPPPLKLPATFRTSKGARVSFYVAAPALCALLICAGFIVLFPAEKTPPIWLTALVILLVLGMNAVCIAALLGAHRQRLVITNDYIELREFTKVRRIPLADIEGFREVPQAHSIWLYPRGGGKPMKPGWLERTSEFKAWLAENLVDLNRRDAEREEKDILANEELGLSEDDRRLSLERARGWCRLLNGAGMILTLWAFFYPRPYSYLMLALAVMPALALAALYLLKGTVRFDAPRHSAYPTTAGALLMPPLGLFLRAFLDWNLLDWGRVALLAGAFALLGAGAILVLSKEARSKWWSVVGVLLICAAYGFGVTIQANCLLDRAEAERHRVTVLGKRKAGSKTTEYYLKVTAWGDREDGEEVKVSRAQYERAAEGSHGTVYVKPGALGARWYVVIVGPPATDAGGQPTPRTTPRPPAASASWPSSGRSLARPSSWSAASGRASATSRGAGTARRGPALSPSSCVSSWSLPRSLACLSSRP